MSSPLVPLNLNVFLINEEVTEHSSILGVDQSKLQCHELDYDGESLGSLYLRPQKKKTPRWTALFSPAAGTDVETLIATVSASALWILQRHGRIFAMSFGYGRGLLDMSVVDERFGLITTLNSIHSDTIRSIDRKVVGSNSRQVREQASRGTETRFFGLNVEQDLLRSVTGESRVPALGSRLTGKAALSAAVKINLASIDTFLEAALTQYKKNDYKSEFSWVDNMREVASPAVRKALDDSLVLAIREGPDSDNLWLAVPELVDWNRVGGFRYSPSDDADQFEDLHFESFLDSLRSRSTVSLSTLKSRKAYCVDRETEAVSLTWPVYRCIAYEVSVDEQTYVLNEGKWYEVEPDFVSEVSTYVNALQPSSIAFPGYSHSGEAAYNEALCEAIDGLHLMDQKNIVHGGGGSRIEFCDAFSSAGTLIHVKRYSGSATLSHLFAQGAVSAELFLLDGDFRKKVCDRLPASHALDPGLTPQAGKYEVAYGIISKSSKPLNLPFFSRVNLRNAARRLQGFGFSVSVTKIQA